MGRTTDKILGYSVAFAIIGAAAAWIYVAYGPDIAKTLDDIQKGKLGGSLSDDPILGNKNPFDQVLQKNNPFQSRGTDTDNKTQPIQTYNLPKVNKTVPTIGEILRRSNAGSSYALTAEEERPESWASLTH
jgi:hypothetical protein